MRLRLLVCLPLILSIGCSKSSKAKNSPDPKTACMSKVASSGTGQEITAEKIASGEDVSWVLTGTDVFQSIEGAGKSLYVAVQVKNIGSGIEYSRLCGGGSAGMEGDFNLTIPKSINARNGVVSSYFYLTFGADAQSLKSLGTQAKSGPAERMIFPKKDGASHRIMRIDGQTLEVWASFPSDDGSGSGRFVFRSTYKANGTGASNVQPGRTRPDWVTPLPSQPKEQGSSLEIYQEAYNYAYESSGLNLHRAAAMDFAANVSSMGFEAGSRYLKVYKNAYDFFCSSNGVNLSRQNAMTNADAVAKTPNSETAFEKFKKAYHFGYGSHGLNLTREQALKFAAQQSGVKLP